MGQGRGRIRKNGNSSNNLIIFVILLVIGIISQARPGLGSPLRSLGARLGFWDHFLLLVIVF